MTLSPIHDNLLVVPEQRADEHEGLALPEDRDEGLQEPEFAIVIAVGPGRRLENGERRPMTVQRGDRVCYRKYDHHEHKINGELCKLVPESEVLFVADRGVALGVAGL